MPLEAILVHLVRIHRRFIARCYPRACPAVGHQCLHNKTALYRRVHPAGRQAPSSVLQARGGVNQPYKPYIHFCGMPCVEKVYLGWSAQNGKFFQQHLPSTGDSPPAS
jgi:hypothetical protein